MHTAEQIKRHYQRMTEWPYHEPERCVCAAIQLKSGWIVYGYRHDRCFRHLEALGIPRNLTLDATQGFMTNEGRFVDRHEGMRVQRASGLPSMWRPEAHLPPRGEYHGDMLFSEDLY